MDTVRMEIDLPEEFAAFVWGRAENDRVTPGEVLGDALRRLRDEEAYMRRMVAEADADQRPDLTEEEMDAEVLRWEEEWEAAARHGTTPVQR